MDIARYLIDQGADVNRGDSGGWTPLHIAGMPATSESFTGRIFLGLCADVYFLASVWWFRGRGHGTIGLRSRCEPGKWERPHCSVSLNSPRDVVRANALTQALRRLKVPRRGIHFLLWH